MLSSCMLSLNPQCQIHSKILIRLREYTHHARIAIILDLLLVPRVITEVLQIKSPRDVMTDWLNIAIFQGHDRSNQIAETVKCSNGTGSESFVILRDILFSSTIEKMERETWNNKIGREAKRKIAKEETMRLGYRCFDEYLEAFQ